MPTTREQVSQAVITALSGINGSDPYSTEVEEVFPFDVSPDSSVAKDCTIGVFPRSFQIQRNQTRLSHGADCAAIFILGIRGILKSSVETVPDNLSRFVADIERALFKNVNLGILTNAVRIETLVFENEGIYQVGAGAYCGFLASLTVAWLTD